MFKFTNDSFMKNAFEFAPIGMAIISLDGYWLKVNPSLSTITGYSIEELLQLNYMNVTHPEDMTTSKNFINELKNGNLDSCCFEKRYIHKAGNIVWVQITSSLIRDKDEQPLYYIVQIQDISERKEMEHHLKKSEERLRVIFEKAGVGIAIRDQNKKALEANPMYLDVLGYEREEFLNMNFAELSHPDDIVLENELIQEILEGKRDYYSMEKRYLRKDKQWRWTYLTVCLFPSDNEGPDYLLATIVDITERKNAEQKLIEANDQLLHLSSIDGLTGIANRRHFDQFLIREWNSNVRIRSPFSIILFDIDFFKKYNDSYGHLFGDDCLKKVAETVSKRIKRKTDLLARFGGEEFAVILPFTDREGALHVAHDIHLIVNALKIPHKSSDISDFITISIGVATIVPNDSNQSIELINMADQALYEAKKQGRNRVVEYKTGMPIG